jgi:hypothetical protein
MLNLKYKNVCISEITVDVPEKCSGETIGYCSGVKYSREDFSFQTPKLEILSKDTAKFNIIKEPLFYSFLEDLQDFFVSTLSKNSEKFFKGKKFSEEKIRESLGLMSLVEGEVYLRNLDMGDSTFFDLLHEETSAPISFPYAGNCILQIKSLSYVKSLILPVFKVLSIKIGKEVRIKPDSCVLLDECEEEIQEEEIEEEKDNLDFFEEE